MRRACGCHLPMQPSSAYDAIGNWCLGPMGPRRILRLYCAALHIFWLHRCFIDIGHVKVEVGACNATHTHNETKPNCKTHCRIWNWRKKLLQKKSKYWRICNSNVLTDFRLHKTHQVLDVWAHYLLKHSTSQTKFKIKRCEKPPNIYFYSLYWKCDQSLYLYHSFLLSALTTLQMKNNESN